MLRIALLLPCFLIAGCHNATAPIASMPAPAPRVTESKPTIRFFQAEPSTVAEGESSSLQWSVEHAATVEIDHNIGPVAPSDHRAISPQETTRYVLRARNASGTDEKTVTVNVSKPASSTAEQQQARLMLLNNQLKDVHFDYNDGSVRPEEKQILEQDALLLTSLLRTEPGARVVVEGHCDERGSAEYNMALGNQRAMTVKESPVKLGLPDEKLRITTYGKERPLCGDNSEECHALNRRVHFSAVSDVLVTDARH